jgi:hypothetical protein
MFLTPIKRHNHIIGTFKVNPKELKGGLKKVYKDRTKGLNTISRIKGMSLKVLLNLLNLRFSINHFKPEVKKVTIKVSMEIQTISSDSNK